VCGLVVGTVEERQGNNSDERAICRLPFDILIRFMKKRRPGAGENAAMEQVNSLMEMVKSAVMLDPSRGGNASLVQWAGDIINGTSVQGIARPLTAFPNEAFFSASISGACAWSKLY
jgi:hypothetical protein